MLGLRTSIYLTSNHLKDYKRRKHVLDRKPRLYESQLKCEKTITLPLIEQRKEYDEND